MKWHLRATLRLWYQGSFKNKVLVAVLATFVCIYGITLQFVYWQASQSLLNATQKEALSTTGILAMGLYRSYEIDNEQREIQSFIVGSQQYRENVLDINIISRQLQVIASTLEDNIAQLRTQPDIRFALTNAFSVKVHQNASPPYVRVIYPISAGPGANHFVVGVIESRFDISQQLQSLENIRLTTLWAGAIIIVAMGLALSRISYTLTRPIETLYQGMQEVDNNNLEIQVEVTTQDEIGFLSTTFNKMIQSLKLMIEASTRFVPSEFLEMLDKDNFTHVALGDAKNTNICVLFMDIRDFTRFSNYLNASDVLKFLNSINQHLLPAIEQNHGFIDKYIGDAIMAIFPKQPDHALFAAVAMLKGLANFNNELKDKDAHINIGIGINSGEVIVGTVGSQQRMDTTVIGNTVNIASRLEGLTKDFQVSIIFSEQVYEQLQPATLTTLNIDPLGQVSVKGVDEPILVYGLRV